MNGGELPWAADTPRARVPVFPRLGRRVCGALLGMLLPGGCSHPARQPEPLPSFTDVTSAAGIRFVHDNGAYGRKLFPEMMGSGAAFIDANGDGLPDIFLVNGSPMPGHPHPNGEPSRLYLNRGDGTFADHTAGSGLEEIGYGMGAAVGDVDNDGHEDLYVTRLGKNSLYLGRGDGTFKDVTAAAGVETGGFSTSAAFVDYDGDGRLDLYVCRYVPWTGLKDDFFCRNPLGKKQYCDVHVYGSMEHRLYHNLGGARFEDATRNAGIAGHEGRGLAVVCGDLDGDGRPDILVDSDETPNFLWHNGGNGRFQEIGAAMGFAYNDQGKATAGMGLDLADADGDGSPDIIESDFQGERKTLYFNDGHGIFTPNARNRGIGEMTSSRLSFGIGFLDFDLDGWPDIFVSNGHVIDDVNQFDRNIPYEQTAQLFRNLGGGHYADASAQLGAYGRTPRVGRGAAFGDFDNDGATDILLLNNHEPAVLLRSGGRSGNHWLGLRCIGTRGNRMGIGARVEVEAGGRKRVAEVRASRSYLSSSDPRLLFGLGTTGRVDRVTVRWPGSKADPQEFSGVPVDRYVTLTEGQADWR